MAKPSEAPPGLTKTAEDEVQNCQGSVAEPSKVPLKAKDIETLNKLLLDAIQRCAGEGGPSERSKLKPEEALRLSEGIDRMIYELLYVTVKEGPHKGRKFTRRCLLLIKGWKSLRSLLDLPVPEDNEEEKLVGKESTVTLITNFMRVLDPSCDVEKKRLEIEKLYDAHFAESESEDEEEEDLTNVREPPGFGEIPRPSYPEFGCDSEEKAAAAAASGRNAGKCEDENPGESQKIDKLVASFSNLKIDRKEFINELSDSVSEQEKNMKYGNSPRYRADVMTLWEKSINVIYKNTGTGGTKQAKSTQDNHTRSQSVYIQTRITRIHGTVKDGKYTCIQCDYCNVNSANLQEHKISFRHGTALDRNMKYMCIYCDYSTIARAELQRHIDRRHGAAEAKKYSCTQCDYWSFQNAHLQSHIDRAHSAHSAHSAPAVLDLSKIWKKLVDLGV